MDDALKPHKEITLYTQNLLDAVRKGEMPGWQFANLEGVDHWIQPDGKAFHIDDTQPVKTEEHGGQTLSIVPMVREWYPRWPAAECHHSDEARQVSLIVESEDGSRKALSKPCRYCSETFVLSDDA